MTDILFLCTKNSGILPYLPHPVWPQEIMAALTRTTAFPVPVKGRFRKRAEAKALHYYFNFKTS